MLRDPRLGPDAQTNLRIINRSGDHLLALINDVLEMSKIEAGQLQLNPTPFSLARLLDDVAGMFRLRAEAKALRFEVDADGVTARYIVSDEGKIRQVLINLLGNAIKFTERGHIKLHVTLSESNESKAWFSARVEDTGSGISDEDQKKLFQSFSQTKSGVDVQQGTGLGLAISRAHARLMGGDLTCASSIWGTGSLFQFDVPVERADAKVAVLCVSPRRVIGIRGGTDRPEILIVDDQAENRDWLMKLLATIGFSVRGADNGDSAIRVWEELKPRLILMDVHMPIMDGLEATRKIKADPRGRETAIVVLTASAMDEERRHAFDNGADDFLPKPCREEDLLATIGTLLKIAYDYEETGADSEAAAQPPVSNAWWLGQLPLDLAEELRDATLRGNKKLLNKAIGKLRESGDAGFANAIQDLADGYQYDVLAQLLEEACRR